MIAKARWHRFQMAITGVAVWPRDSLSIPLNHGSLAGNQRKADTIIDTKYCKYKRIKGVAERVGFEPTVGVNLHTLSKRAP